MLSYGSGNLHRPDIQSFLLPYFLSLLLLNSSPVRVDLYFIYAIVCGINKNLDI
jgi:hypothetical protein